jgi:hypothetical protein
MAKGKSSKSSSSKKKNTVVDDKPPTTVEAEALVVELSDNVDTAPVTT